MPHEPPPRGAKSSWAYAYQIMPPQPEDRLRAVKALLDQERKQATLGERTWEGRLVTEQQATHILIVSDSPDQDLEANRRLEAELQGLEVGFALTLPMSVTDEPVPPAPDPTLSIPDPPGKPGGRLPPKP